MKTAMQEAIEYLRKHNLLSAAIILEDKFLEKEKRQIEDACEYGLITNRSVEPGIKYSGKNYFKNVYNERSN